MNYRQLIKDAKAAYAFWFADKDWVGKWGKIWTYECSNQAK